MRNFCPLRIMYTMVIKPTDIFRRYITDISTNLIPRTSNWLIIYVENSTLELGGHQKSLSAQKQVNRATLNRLKQ